MGHFRGHRWQLVSVLKSQSVEFNPADSEELSEAGNWHTAETTNGDSPGYTSSSPTPERIDEAFFGESPLEKSITDPEKYATVLE
jgi:hypothetical protein